MATTQVELAKINIRGVVQGVGFRPFVYQLANRHKLNGWVRNTSEGVSIEIEGHRAILDRFLIELREQAPPMARIESLTTAFQEPAGYHKFEIKESLSEQGKYQLISPDIATCHECLADITDIQNRRFQYPFTNCTNCGPRFTIIEDIPYDRPNTTMRHFTMCPECLKEYETPSNRRFHAQPNACPQCGPQIRLLDATGRQLSCADVIEESSALLIKGAIIAIKGLGGFLLACDATNEAVVQNLRQRKRRPCKPFAVMVADITEAEKHCLLTNAERTMLLSPQSPIILAPWKRNSSVLQNVSPQLRYLGIMLPYTPLHHLLLKQVKLPLVMTSGNISEEPITRDNEEVLRRLSSIADYFLVHNRDIHSTYDDSVLFFFKDTPQMVRRARSYAPHPIHLSFQSEQILACGAEEKSNFCLTRDDHAFVSQHIGDLKNLETMEHFTDTVGLYKKLFRIEPKVIAHDMHPDYLSTKYAREQGSVKLISVQHHHAHIASCMADNALSSPVIGVALDGTGFGIDGHIWGGEFLVSDYGSFRRAGHLQYLPLPGGDAAIQRPYRTAIGYIATLLNKDALQPILPFLKTVATDEINIILKQLDAGFNTPLTSSMGRLFDAVSAMLGIRQRINYEGQAAVELEMAAYDYRNEATGLSYPYILENDNGTTVVLLQNLFDAIIKDIRRGEKTGLLSLKFHHSIAAIINDMCAVIRKDTGINNVALSGGVFQNRLLLEVTVPLLENNGFIVFTHRQVPCNDGGISLGQAVIAHHTVQGERHVSGSAG